MVKVRFIDSADTEHFLDVPSGFSAMEAAIRNDVPGIAADCGGACSCATCHVYVDPAWVDRVGPPDDMEQSMLEFAENPTTNSRLACQVKLSDALDGLVLRIPST